MPLAWSIHVQAEFVVPAMQHRTAEGAEASSPHSPAAPTTHAAASLTQGLAEAEEADQVAQPPPAARKQAPPQLEATGSGQIGAFYPKEVLQEAPTTASHCCPVAQPPSMLRLGRCRGGAMLKCCFGVSAAGACWLKCL